MGIAIGTQLVAPGGFKQLEAVVTYYFLWSDSERERVYLVQFLVRPPKKRLKADRHGRCLVETPTPLPILVAVRRSQFELGVGLGAILHQEHQAALPPWLEPLEGLNFAAVDMQRTAAQKQHSQRIDEMIEAITPLVVRYQEVLGAKDPDRVINKHARNCKPVKNETRLRLAFYCYLVFGRNRYALHYPIHKIGVWDRERDAEGAKRGRKRNGLSKNAGHNVDQNVLRLILKGYKRRAKLGVSMTEIYRLAMTEDFGCRERKGLNGYLSYYHPDGKPFPTLGQYDYHVAKELGRAEIQRLRLGPNRVRTELAPSLGPFTQAVANLMERVEVDGYFLGERPQGLVDGSTLPHLCVVRKRDTASGLITGIGFSFGGETAAAYRMASFCEAIDKVKFYALFGILIEASQYPSRGISPHGIADRGPGSTDGAHPKSGQHGPVIRGMAPSYAGQSKATVESTHPKKLKNQEAPSHLKSEKNVFELARRELHRVLMDNERIDITSRITPDLWAKVRKPCPNELWTVLDSLGRNDAVLMSFEEAVRAYLEPVEVVVKADYIYLHGQKYDSPALRSTGLLDRVAASQEMRIMAYVLTACVRHIWVDVDKDLIEVDLQAGLRVGDEVLYMPLSDLVQREAEMQLIATNFSEHQHAVASKGYREYEEQTGYKFNGASRKAGRPKSGTPIAVIEAAESRIAMRGKKVA